MVFLPTNVQATNSSGGGSGASGTNGTASITALG